MVFLFILLVIIFIVLSLFTLKLQFRIQNIDFSTGRKEKNLLNKNYKFIVLFYLLDKVPIFKLTINQDKLLKIKNQDKLKEKMEKVNAQILHNDNKIDNKILQIIKNLKFNVKEFDLYMEVGTEDVMLTTFLVPLFSILSSFFLSRYTKNELNKWFYIKPLYLNKNMLNFQFSGIFEFKLIHIINTICVISKERKGEENERTSNRGAYDYSYE